MKKSVQSYLYKLYKIVIIVCDQLYASTTSKSNIFSPCLFEPIGRNNCKVRMIECENTLYTIEIERLKTLDRLIIIFRPYRA